MEGQMAKQNSKAELLKDIQAQRRHLEKTLAGIRPADKVSPGVCGEWSIKDGTQHVQSLLLG
jgi:hypothetical protein